VFERGARRLIIDAWFDRSGSKCFSRDEVKCQSSLSWRQAEMALQPINGLVHDEIRDGPGTLVPLLGDPIVYVAGLDNAPPTASDNYTITGYFTPGPNNSS
jgi:hypothetical protein